jgi:UDP-N-acetylmuramate dehydrogenase
MITEGAEKIAGVLSSPVHFDQPLSGYSSMRVGGAARILAQVEKRSELALLLALLGKEGQAWRVIGRGTNLLIADSGYQGVVVILSGELSEFRFVEEGNRVVANVGAGCSLARLTSACTRSGIAGLEFAAGIPGSVGGAVIMNAGAWGTQFSDIIESVEITTAGGSFHLPAAELDFGYRSCKGFSQFKNTGVVTGAHLLLERDEKDQVASRCKEYAAQRKLTQPGNYPNIGSFFKNPPGTSAGKLIEESGLKGTRVGGAMISPVHANFIVNYDQATASDIVELMELAQRQVFRQKGVRLIPEVHFLGFEEEQ